LPGKNLAKTVTISLYSLFNPPSIYSKMWSFLFVFSSLVLAEVNVQNELQSKLAEYGMSDLLESLLQKDLTLQDLYDLNEEEVKGLSLSLGNTKKLQRLINSNSLFEKHRKINESKCGDLEKLKQRMTSHDVFIRRTIKWQQALLAVLPSSYGAKFAQSFSNYKDDSESAYNDDSESAWSEVFETAAPNEATKVASRGLEQLGASDSAVFALRASDSQVQMGPSGDIILYRHSNGTLGVSQNVIISGSLIVGGVMFSSLASSSGYAAAPVYSFPSTSKVIRIK
jgi:hypothetical protein